MSTKYTTGFKEQAVQKALTRGNASLKSLVQELNVGYSTLQKWIRDYKKVNPTNDNNQRPQDWTREQQLQAIIDTSVMNEAQRNQYCREHGIYPHNLDAWRLSFLQTEKGADTSHKVELKTLKEENVSLHKEIRRKDKALAETAALLVLQKKFQSLLEGKGK